MQHYIVVNIEPDAVDEGQFWREPNQGTTSDIDQAHRFTKPELDRQNVIKNDNAIIVEEFELLQMLQVRREVNKGKIKGARVCFTGKLQRKTRADSEQEVRDYGGVAKQSVTSSLDILVAGPGAGVKLAKAEKLGVLIMDEDDWHTYLENNATPH